MGNCSSKKSTTVSNTQVQQHKQPEFVCPEHYYLHREKKILLKVDKSGIEKFKFQKDVKTRKKSAVGIIDGSFYAAGGEDSASCLTKQFLKIDPASRTTTKLSSLPIPTKGGNLHKYNNWIYLVGAKNDDADEESAVAKQPAPLMRYDIRSNRWQIFSSFKREHTKNKVMMFINHCVTDRHREEQEQVSKVKDFSLRELVSPGSFILGSKIYLVGGYRVNSKGQLKCTKRVYSLDISNDEDIRFDCEEQLRLPFKVAKPHCFAGTETVVVMGGKLGKSKRFNYCACQLRPKDDQTEKLVRMLDPIPVPVSGNYPPMKIDDYIAFFSFPNILLINKSSNWIQYSIKVEKHQHSAESDTLRFIPGQETKPEEIPLSLATKYPRSPEKKTQNYSNVKVDVVEAKASKDHSSDSSSSSSQKKSKQKNLPPVKNSSRFKDEASSSDEEKQNSRQPQIKPPETQKQFRPSLPVKKKSNSSSESKEVEIKKSQYKADQKEAGPEVNINFATTKKPPTENVETKSGFGFKKQEKSDSSSDDKKKKQLEKPQAKGGFWFRKQEKSDPDDKKAGGKKQFSFGAKKESPGLNEPKKPQIEAKKKAFKQSSSSDSSNTDDHKNKEEKKVFGKPNIEGELGFKKQKESDSSSENKKSPGKKEFSYGVKRDSKKEELKIPEKHDLHIPARKVPSSQEKQVFGKLEHKESSEEEKHDKKSPYNFKSEHAHRGEVDISGKGSIQSSPNKPASAKLQSAKKKTGFLHILGSALKKRLGRESSSSSESPKAQMQIEFEKPQRQAKAKESSSESSEEAKAKPRKVQAFSPEEKVKTPPWAQKLKEKQSKQKSKDSSSSSEDKKRKKKESSSSSS